MNLCVCVCVCVCVCGDYLHEIFLIYKEAVYMMQIGFPRVEGSTKHMALSYSTTSFKSDSEQILCVTTCGLIVLVQLEMNESCVDFHHRVLEQL